MVDGVVFHHGTTMVRRLRLAPSEAMPRHRDPFQRVAVVLQGDVLSIEYRDGGGSQQVEVTPGLVDWEEPSACVHRAVNVGYSPMSKSRFSCSTDPTQWRSLLRNRFRVSTILALHMIPA